MQAEVQERRSAAIAQLEALGGVIREISLPHTEYALDVYYILAPAEASANLARFDGVRTTTCRGEFRFRMCSSRRAVRSSEPRSNPPDHAGDVRAFGRLSTMRTMERRKRFRTLIKRDFDMAFELVDLIACPATPTTAFEIGAHKGDPLSMYLEDIFTLPASLAGCPGISFPVGFDGKDFTRLGCSCSRRISVRTVV